MVIIHSASFLSICKSAAALEMSLWGCGTSELTFPFYFLRMQSYFFSFFLFLTLLLTVFAFSLYIYIFVIHMPRPDWSTSWLSVLSLFSLS